MSRVFFLPFAVSRMYFLARPGLIGRTASATSAFLPIMSPPTAVDRKMIPVGDIQVAIATGFHLFPSRTEKLSPPAPMVLQDPWESR